MDSSVGHNFQVSDLYWNALCVEILTHGIYTAIASIAMYSLATHFKKQFSHAIIALLILTMYTLATVHVSLRWYWIRQAFVVHGSTIEGTVGALGDTQYLWIWMASGISASLNILIADCILIWRCWSIWARSWKVIVVPVLCTIVGIIFTGFFIYQEQPHPSAQWSSWGASINWGVPYFAMSLATTLLCTSLIVFRIWHIGRTEALRTYHRAVEIIVESAALYCVSLLIFLVFFVRDDLNTGYPQAILYSITGIAPTLIVVRVVVRPRSYDTSTVPSTHLHFGGGSERDRSALPIHSAACTTKQSTTDEREEKSLNLSDCPV